MTTNLLIQNLQSPTAYNHPTKNFQLIETHVSWVILTGDYVYKIKKPVDFEFLNFSTLEKRKFYCEEEIRLNKFLTPEIYLDVVTINGTPENPVINGSGTIIEYAIKMREFPQEILFSELLKQEKITLEHINDLAKLIADFHQRTPVAATDSVLGTPEHVHAPVLQNFDQIAPLLTDNNDLQQLAKLRAWAEQQFKLHKTQFQQRKTQGFIRDCHGDLHLGNIILYNQKPLLFDRIEFNEDFRWTDVLADIGFLAMDLEEKHQPALAHLLINTYFTYTGDYAGLALLPYYQAYRAMVRAKISLFRLGQPGISQEEKQLVQKDYRNFIQLAEHYAEPAKPKLLITHGLTGSGKSTVARFLVEKLGVIQISSDIERKRLFSVPFDAQNHAPIYGGIYTPEANQKTYQHLSELANNIIHSGYSVIVDATFLKNEQRNLLRGLAKKLKIPFAILSCQTPYEQLEKAILTRNSENRDPSEARLDILARLEKDMEKLQDDEQRHTIIINTQQFDPNGMIKTINAL